jgi:hypothetical protein
MGVSALSTIGRAGALAFALGVCGAIAGVSGLADADTDVSDSRTGARGQVGPAQVSIARSAATPNRRPGLEATTNRRPEPAAPPDAWAAWRAHLEAASVFGQRPLIRQSLRRCGGASVAFGLKARLSRLLSHPAVTAGAELCRVGTKKLVTPLAAAEGSDVNRLLEHVTAWGLREGRLQRGDRILLVAGIGFGTGGHNMALVHEV